MNIRPASKNDVAAIYELTRELAAYENAIDHFKATPEYFLNAFFGEHASTECYLIEDQHNIVGMGQVFITLGTYRGGYNLNLQDFVIRKEYRSQGYGKKFMQFIAKLAKDRDCTNIKWSVVAWNESAISFYRSLAKTVPADINFVMSPQHIEKLIATAA